LRNELLRKELLAFLCSVFWFWFLSFSFPSLFVCDSFGYHHNSAAALSDFLAICGGPSGWSSAARKRPACTYKVYRVPNHARSHSAKQCQQVRCRSARPGGKTGGDRSAATAGFALQLAAPMHTIIYTELLAPGRPIRALESDTFSATRFELGNISAVGS
jgi:hypothetical protein